jgi:hypothetical protein
MLTLLAALQDLQLRPSQKYRLAAYNIIRCYSLVLRDSFTYLSGSKAACCLRGAIHHHPTFVA